MNKRQIIVLSSALALVVISIVGAETYKQYRARYLVEAEAFLAIDDRPSAIDSYQKHVLENPNDFENRMSLAELTYLVGDVDKSMKIWKKVIEDHPTLDTFERYDQFIDRKKENVESSLRDPYLNRDPASYIEKSQLSKAVLTEYAQVAYDAIIPPGYEHVDVKTLVKEYVQIEALIAISLSKMNTEIDLTKLVNTSAFSGEVIVAFKGGDRKYSNFWSLLTPDSLLKVYFAKQLYEVGRVARADKEYDQAFQLFDQCSEISKQLIYSMRSRSHLIPSGSSPTRELRIEPLNDVHIDCMLGKASIYSYKEDLESAMSTIDTLEQFRSERCVDCYDITYRLRGERFSLPIEAINKVRERASSAFGMKDWETAISAYSRAAELDEQYTTSTIGAASSRYSAAMAMRNAGKPEAAFEALTVLLDKYPDQAPEDTSSQIAESREQIETLKISKARDAGEEALGAEDWIKAKESLLEAADLAVLSVHSASRAPTYLSIAARAASLSGAYREAIQLLTKIRAVYPNHEPEDVLERIAQNERSITYQRIEELVDKAQTAFDASSWVQAIAYFKDAEIAALKYDNKELAAENAYNVATSYNNAKRFREALSVYRAVQSMYPLYEPTLIAEQILDLNQLCQRAPTLCR